MPQWRRTLLKVDQIANMRSWRFSAVGLVASLALLHCSSEGAPGTPPNASASQPPPGIPSTNPPGPGATDGSATDDGAPSVSPGEGQDDSGASDNNGAAPGDNTVPTAPEPGEGNGQGASREGEGHGENTTGGEGEGDGEGNGIIGNGADTEGGEGEAPNNNENGEGSNEGEGTNEGSSDGEGGNNGLRPDYPLPPPYTSALNYPPQRDNPLIDTSSLPTLESLPQGQWTEIHTGGDTRCARGGDYSFYVRRGSSKKVIVDFMGGGSCWSEGTCTFARSLFYDSVEDLRGRVDMSNLPGFYDHDNPDHPAADWTHLVLPYCTGDLHWGNATQAYGEGEDAFTIEHRGAKNSATVLDWLGNAVADPEDIMVTGCSAGSYGSIFWTPYLSEVYPNARMTQLGDSGAGIITTGFFATAAFSWQVLDYGPYWLPEMSPSVFFDMQLPQFYNMVGDTYPNVRLAQFNRHKDATQVFYYAVMGGGTALDWNTELMTSLEEVTTPNFFSYVAAGEAHCILVSHDFYDIQTEGQYFHDWVEQLLHQRAPPQNIECSTCNEAQNLARAANPQASL